VGKNKSNELNIKRFSSTEASQMLPTPVFSEGKASFSTWIEMANDLHH